MHVFCACIQTSKKTKTKRKLEIQELAYELTPSKLHGGLLLSESRNLGFKDHKNTEEEEMLSHRVLNEDRTFEWLLNQ